MTYERRSVPSSLGMPLVSEARCEFYKRCRRFVFSGSLIFIHIMCLIAGGLNRPSAANDRFKWTHLEDLPDPLGVAGPFVGLHNDALIIAGGANFPKPVWETDKVWHRKIHVLKPGSKTLGWSSGGDLRQPLAYGAAVSTPHGVLCIGGNHADKTSAETFLLRWDPRQERVRQVALSPLPKPCAYGAAAIAGNRVYLVGGQSGPRLDTAMKNVWMLDMPDDLAASESELASLKWQSLGEFPGVSRAFNLTVVQHNGFNECLYVFSGRRQSGESVQFLKDTWEYDLKRKRWRQRADAPRSVMAGVGIDFGQSHVLVLGGDDGKNFFKSDELRDRHPGFLRDSLLFHTITNTWTSAGKTPANHVTTIAVRWNDRIIVPTGEVRPRVRSPKIWSIEPVESTRHGFGMVNYIVLFIYLSLIVGVGLWFARRNNSTDQYFRGGKSLPWWAAGCSIFATMLSSLTYTGVPAKAYAQDWVYAIGNFMIPVVAVIAVFVALPFFRRLDATSAYEYLEHRFNFGVRLFGSASFSVFHLFRMAVVMSLTGLALAVATPLTPTQSVLLIGVLSILYCTLGGIEAVIWTDTVQTFVLMSGAIVAILLLVAGVDSGWYGVLAAARDSDKLRIANFHWDATDTQIALWVIIVGGIAQNLSSYTSDQAVVQRYMTTADSRLAARSIWTNALLTIPATLMFFGVGTLLFVFYQSHPERLDPTISTDQIFPMFIAREMPIGLAGLLVAGIFAAAQSTVSTSMNSTATTLVTDFLRPLTIFSTDHSYLVAARILTFLMGVAGTGLALMFVDSEIKSLFDEFIKVIGLFMGVLGGLFVLGGLTTRANGAGAFIGAVVGAASMFYLWKYTPVNGYLYTAAGIVICFCVGYLTSLTSPPKPGIEGLTIYGALKRRTSKPQDS